MDFLRPAHEGRIGSVKAALQLFGERSEGGDAFSYKDSGQLSISTDVTYRLNDLHLARNDTGRLRDNQISSENDITRLRSELSDARKAAQVLALHVEESKARARARKQELEKRKSGEEVLELENDEMGNCEYMEVVMELEAKKRELSSLKLDMVSVLGEKVKAEEETKAAHLRLKSNLKCIENIGEEIDEVDEECVLIELARIEAIKESKELVVQKELVAKRHSQKLQESRARIVELKKEVNHAKKLEQKLFVTMSDVDVLQSEMMFVRAMEKKFTYKLSLEKREKSNEIESENARLLQAAQANLGAAKKELASIKEVAFKYMAAMDSIREKMMHVSNEASRLRKLHEDTDLKVQDLNAKLLKANYKFEVASNSQRGMQAVVSNLSAAISNTQSDIERARKERELAVKETEHLKAEIRRNDSIIGSTKEALLTAMLELELIKSSESAALDKLRTLSERTLKSRSVFSPQRSTITIPQFEHEYLVNCAAAAKEIANTKVEAAQLWIEAFGASEKEALLQIEWIQRKLQELDEYVEDLQPHKVEKELIVGSEEKRRRSQVEREPQTDKLEQEWTPPRKSVKENGISTSRRSSLQRKSTSNSMTPGRASVSLRRRKKVMINLAKFLRGRKVEARDSGV